MNFGHASFHRAPMRVCALSAGRHAPRDRFTGSVHSVFRRACNIERRDGGTLVLLAAELGNAPHGVRLATPPGFAFDRHVQIGDAAGCRAGVLRVGRDTMTVDLRDAATWHVDLSAPGVDPGRRAVAAAYRAARRALGKTGSDDRAGLAGAARDRLEAVAGAAAQFDAVAGGSAMERLIGTGIGLTPSGDDLAVGYLAGLWSTAGSCPRRLALVTSLAAAMRDAAGRTGAVSRAYLVHAAGGQVAEPLAALAVAIASGAPDGTVSAAVNRTAAVGASSGREGVVGLLRGLETWAFRSAYQATGRRPIHRPVQQDVDSMEFVYGQG